MRPTLIVSIFICNKYAPTGQDVTVAIEPATNAARPGLDSLPATGDHPYEKPKTNSVAWPFLYFPVTSASLAKN
jgi:hypothetical protein